MAISVKTKLADPYAVVSVLYFKCLSAGGQNRQLINEPVCPRYWLLHKDMTWDLQHKTHDNHRNKAIPMCREGFPPTYLSQLVASVYITSLCALEASLGTVTVPAGAESVEKGLGYNLLQCVTALGLCEHTMPLPVCRIPALCSRPVRLAWWLLEEPAFTRAESLAPGHPGVGLDSDPTKGGTAGLQA